MDERRFRASWWCRGGHAQTLWPVLVQRRVGVVTREERLELPDGDFVRLDWAGEGTGPIVIVLPGLQGGLTSHYVGRLLRACMQRGWRALVLNHRGCGEPNRLPRGYHCGMTCDLEHLVALLRERESDVPVAVVGYSLGANIALKWVGEAGREGREVPVRAVAAVSAPLNLAKAARHLERGFSRIYQRHLLRSLYRDVEAKLRVMDCGLTITPAELRRLNTFFKFDDRITAPLHGFASAADYYERTRTDVLLRHIQRPTLIVNALDDPFIPPSVLPTADMLSDQVMLEVVPTGGHVGFVEGRVPWRWRSWIDGRVMRFVAPHVECGERFVLTEGDAKS